MLLSDLEIVTRVAKSRRSCRPLALLPLLGVLDIRLVTEDGRRVLILVGVSLVSGARLGLKVTQPGPRLLVVAQVAAMVALAALLPPIVALIVLAALVKPVRDLAVVDPARRRILVHADHV